MKVLINISNIEDYDFFKRFYRSFEHLNVEVEFLANNLFIYLILKANKEKVYIVKKKVKRKFEGDSFSELTNRLTKKEAEFVYGSFKEFMEMNYKIHNWSLIIIPSGRLISQIALNEFSKEHNIETLYVGYGNIPNRTFLDPEGTDKSSSLYKNISILDDFYVPDSEYNTWRNSYLGEKLKKHVIGQARELNWKLKFKKFIQITFCYIERFKGLAVENSYYYKDLVSFKKVDYDYDQFDNLQKYIFFPMQVSTDAQIILNYDKKDVISGLKQAISIAKKHGKKLVVKPHPAEINQEVVKNIMELKNNDEFLLTNENTFKLIRNSDEVITINSTVGLESRIYGKKVTFLGDSIYEKMNDQQMKNYIMRYLLKIEYFSDHSVNEDVCKEFLRRANKNYEEKYI